MGTITFAIVTCSDTRDISQDTAGSALEELIAHEGWTCVDRSVVKDERAEISQAIVYACDLCHAFSCGMYAARSAFGDQLAWIRKSRARKLGRCCWRITACHQDDGWRWSLV